MSNNTAEQITVEELHFLESLKKEFNLLNLKVENTKLQYENALFKIMRKYSLSESDSIDETSGKIVRRTPPAQLQAPPAPPQLHSPPSPPAPPPAPVPVAEPVVESEVLKAKKGKRDSK
jgi:hypothetical protein